MFLHLCSSDHVLGLDLWKLSDKESEKNSQTCIFLKNVIENKYTVMFSLEKTETAYSKETEISLTTVKEAHKLMMKYVQNCRHH